MTLHRSRRPGLLSRLVDALAGRRPDPGPAGRHRPGLSRERVDLGHGLTPAAHALVEPDAWIPAGPEEQTGLLDVSHLTAPAPAPAVDDLGDGPTEPITAADLAAVRRPTTVRQAGYLPPLPHHLQPQHPNGATR